MNVLSSNGSPKLLDNARGQIGWRLRGQKRKDAFEDDLKRHAQ